MNRVTFKILLFSLLIMMTAESMPAQSLITESLSTPKKGIYKSFSEFKYNCPSIHSDFEVKEDIVSYRVLDKDAKLGFYYLNIADEDVKLKDIYGFCDGKDIYISLGLIDLSLGLIGIQKVFVKMEYVGRYCIYDYLDRRMINLDDNLVTYEGVRFDHYTKVLDLADGREYTLSNINVKYLLRRDKELLQRFEDQKYKFDHLKAYVIEYAEKHPNETLKFTPREVPDIDSLIYMQVTDSTFEHYFDRVIGYTVDPSISSIELWQARYGNGNLKYAGLVAEHKRAENEDYKYKIGTWRFFYKNGQLKELVNYDFREKKKGEQILYDKTGRIVKQSVY